MDSRTSAIPDLQTLSAALSAVNPEMHGAVVRDRQPNTYSSSAPTEIVTCVLGNGTERKLLCKYSSDDAYTGHGHWGGVAYEAEVYAHVLRSLELSKPLCYGIHQPMKARSTWIVLEYLEDTQHLNKAPNPESILLAARWLGRFHSALDARLTKEPIPFLKKYDATYYVGWSRRTEIFSRDLHGRLPWLPTLCQRFEKELVANLLSSPLTVIHGEFCPANILVRAGAIYPLDWESAAIAAGEIDLACLTDDWGLEAIEACKREYQDARWPEGRPPHFFEQTFAAALLFVQFRWLGDTPEVTTSEKSLWRFEQLRLLGERLGMTATT